MQRKLMQTNQPKWKYFPLIPLSCMGILLAGGLLALYPDWIGTPSVSALNEIGDSTGQPTTSASTTASLTLDTRDIQVRLDAGSIGYASKDITIKATNISSYALTITAPEGLTGPTEFTGADGKTPTDMANNTWGYNYTDGIVDEASLPTIAYNSFTGTAQTLESGTTNPTSNTKTLSFAAKFGNAISGSYKANVVLSLVTTPKAIAFDGITTMQEMTPDICNKADTYASSILRDVRDNNYYTVTKLEDGRCWMTNNLILTAPTGGRVLTPADSDVTADWTMPATLTGLSSTNFSANSTDGYYTAESYYSDISDAGPTGYYSFTAATAGTGNASLTTGNAPSSICPKGWKLPSGGAESVVTDFYGLFSKMNIVYKVSVSDSTPISLKTSGNTYYMNGSDDYYNIVRPAPYDFVFNGVAVNGRFDYISAYGYWWSSTIKDASSAYNLLIDSNFVAPATRSSSRSIGYAIRCIAADPDLTEISTMQEMTPRVCEKSATGATNTLTDTRDGSKYSIRKMEDGKCWMTSNLKLKGDTNLANPNPNNELTPNDTNITSNWKLPSTLTSLSSSNFSSPNYYAVESYISNKANAGETGYYSWAAATAGAGADSNLKSGSVSTSICPKGWRLPGGNGDTVYGNEFYDLFNSMGLGITLSAAGRTNWTSTQLSIVQNSDYNFKFTGNVSGNSLSSTSVGYWWSNTVSSETDARSTDMYSTYAYLGAGSNTRCYGIPVRCIAAQ